MINKLLSYLRVHIDFSVIALMVMFMVAVLATLLGAHQLSDYNIGVVLILFAPLMCIGIFTSVFSKDYQHGFSDLVTTYREPQWRIFFYRYVLSLILYFMPLLLAFLAFFVHPGRAASNPFPVIGQMFSMSLTLANFSILLSIGGKRFDLGTIGGFLAFLALIRIPLPHTVYIFLFPMVAVVCGVGALGLFQMRR